MWNTSRGQKVNADRKKQPAKKKNNMRSVRDLMGFAPAVHQNNAISKDPQAMHAILPTLRRAHTAVMR